MLKPDDDLKLEQRPYLEHFRRTSSEFVTAQQLILAFLQVIKKRDLASLVPWLARAQASGLPELVVFDRGIVRDQDAVTAALRYEASHGITEGHVDIKRTTYGRASFELLRNRVLARV